MIETLQRMLNELSCRHRDKDTIIEECVKTRLDKCLSIYYKELDNSLSIINSCDTMNVIKKVNK